MEQYLNPATISEALDMLGRCRGDARLVAGATDLFLDVERGKKTPGTLVDVRSIPELREIREEADRVYIGAAVTHTRLENSPLIRRYFSALAQGASAVGGPQIRNIGTLGGNVVNAQPAADAAVALFTFDAEAVLVQAGGRETTCPVAKLYIGPGRSALDSTACLLKGFYLPKGRYTASGFARQARRKALALPMLNAAAALRVEDGVIRAAAITAGPVSALPLRLTAAEACLAGKRPDPTLFARAGELAERQASPRDSLLRGSSSYRRRLLSVMVARLLERVVQCGHSNCL